MSLENAQYISELVESNPSSADPKSQGDDHIRQLKVVLKSSFPLFSGQLLIAHDQIASKEYVDNLAFSPVLPGQQGNQGKFLATNGATASWQSLPLSPTASTIVAGIVYLATINDSITGANDTKAVTPAGLTAGATALITARGGTVSPAPWGIATPGVSLKWAREDHAHPIQPEFESGTRIVFSQSTAPTGWVQDTSEAANNRMLRIVSGPGGGTGGTHSPIICNVVPAHTHGFTTGNNSVAHTHPFVTGGQSASHNHGIDFFTAGAPIAGGQLNIISATQPLSQWFSGSGVFSIHSASNDHSHGGTTGGESAVHTHSGSTDNGSSRENWEPRYHNCIVCQKQ